MAKEAGAIAHVAGAAAMLNDLEDQSVIVAVDEDIPDLLKVSRFLSFEP